MKIKNSIVVGSGMVAIKCVRLLKDSGISVTVIEPNKQNFSRMEGQCVSLGIKYQKLSNHSARYLECLPANSLIVSANNNYIFNSNILSQPNIIAINYHNALLPLHRGMNAEAWSIYEQNRESGVTWHKIGVGIDTGEILYQQSLEIGPDETSIQLLSRQAKLAYSMFEENIEDIIHWRINPYKQTGVTCYHRMKDVPNNGYLSEDWDFNKTYAFLRAMDYGPINTLGRPKINVNGTVYIWDKYLVETTHCEKKECSLVGNKILLKYGNDRISLINIQAVNYNYDT